MIGWDWDFGDGQSSSAPYPEQAYRHVGRYNVTLTVVDNAGGHASSTATLSVVELDAGVFKIKGVHHVELSWNTTDADDVELFRDGVPIAATANDGAYVDNTGAKGEATYVYQVCERRPTNRACSTRAAAVFV